MLACCHGRGRIVCELIEKYSMNQHSVSEVMLYLLYMCTHVEYAHCVLHARPVHCP